MILLILAVGVISLLYIWCKYTYSYWTRNNIVSIRVVPFFGNMKDIFLMKRSPAQYFTELYNDERVANEPLMGIYSFNKPALFIRDPELIKQILIKDFNNFANRFSFVDPHRDALGSMNLFFLKNPEWKQIRTKLTPVFTSGKIKQMFSLIEKIGEQLDSYLCELPMDSKTNANCKELKEICALFTTDVIASIAFGLEANSLKNPDGEFRTNGRSIFTFDSWRSFDFNIVFFVPKLVNFLHVYIFKKPAQKFIRSTINYALEEREKSGKVRNDLIDILIAFRNSSRANNESFLFDGDLMIAQAAVFFTAGFETSSSTISFGLYELSKNMDVQNRLREEIKEVLQRNDGKLTYDDITNMEYLNMIVQETLRMYPPLPFLDRECTLAKGEESYSLEPYSKFKVPQGMPVFIPMSSIQRDPKYFPDPDTFNPERFSKDNKNNITGTTYFPFGIGPHNCIGERFGVLQAKIGLVNILRNHTVKLNQKSDKTMILSPKALLTQSLNGIYCDIVRDSLI